MTQANKPTQRACIFCNHEDPAVVLRGEGTLARADGYPVTPGHTLIIPLRHVTSYGELTPEEIGQCHAMMNTMRARLQVDDPTIEGFNIGVNDGVVAGQSIPHVHLHLIPRRAGDIADPRGGIRHLMPGKGYYHDRVVRSA